MTYCAGWKYDNTVFLLSDTAITKGSKPATSHSSFGELHAQVRGEYVEESLLKLVPIGEGLVVAFSGDVELARKYLDFLRDSRTFAQSDTDLLNLLTTSMGPFSSDRTVALLLASSKPDGSCELLRWSTTDGLDQAESDFYAIGSLSSYHAALTPNLLSMLASNGLASERILPIMTAIVQSYGVHDNLIDLNVGGLIFGIQTRGGIVSWQHDTNYVLYNSTNQEFSQSAFISAMARDEMLLVSSSISDDIRVFTHSTSLPSTDLFDQEWFTHRKSELDSGSSRYWIFISTTGKVITVIIRQDVSAESQFVKLQNLGNGKFDLAVSGTLLHMLLQPLSDKGDGSLPFRLNVRND